MRAAIVAAASVLAVAIPAFPADATHVSAGFVDLVLSGGETWEVAILSENVPTIDLRLWANFSGVPGAAVGAFWLSGRYQGFPTFQSAMLFHEYGSTRVAATVNGMETTPVGSDPSAEPRDWNIDWGHLYGSFRKIAWSAPGATDAHLRVTWGAPGVTVLRQYSGATAFRAVDRDFGGTMAEVAYEQPNSNSLEYGASAGLLGSASFDVPAGMIAAFGSDNTYAQLRVDGPDEFGTFSGTCSGIHMPGLTQTDYQCTTPLGNLGYGNAPQAPAGRYTFAVQYEAGYGGYHAYALGAPVDWGAD